MPTLNIKSTQQAIKDQLNATTLNITCYDKEGREVKRNTNQEQYMRQAMRYAVPRMMWHHPIAAIRHLIREL